MRVTHHTLIAIAVVVSTLGCNTSSSDSPLGAFKSFAAKVQSEIPGALSDAKLSDPVIFDVQKTDSLVSPFTAYLTFSFSGEVKDDDPNYWLTQNIRANYSHQEGQWVCKQILFTVEDMQFVSGDRYLFDEVKKQMVGLTSVNIEAADIEASEDEIVKLLQSCN